MFIRKRTWTKKDGKESTRYYVIWEDEDGKRQQGSPGWTSWKAADNRRKEMEKEKAAGTLGKDRPVNPTFAEFCKTFLKDREREIKASTLKDYKSVIGNHLEPFLGKDRLPDIGPGRVRALLRHLQTEEVSAATTGKALRVLRVVMRHALTLELIGRDPTRAVRPPKVDRQPVEHLSVEEVEKMLEAADGFMYPLLAVAAYTGLRQGEILALRWSDIDFGHNFIKVTRSYRPGAGFTSPKTPTSYRVVPLVEVLRDILIDWQPREAHPDDLVFPNRDGGPLDRANLIHRKLVVVKEGDEEPEEVERFEAILDRAGLRHIRFHDLRHTYASIAIEAGVDPKSLQAIMGHSSISVTYDIYGHLYTSSMDRAGMVFNKHLTKDRKVIRLERKSEDGDN